MASIDGDYTTTSRPQRRTPASRRTTLAYAPASLQPAAAQVPLAERWYSEKRLGGLSRFAVAITILNIAGHAFLGFEQSWRTPFVALAASYGTDLLGETIDARCNGRPLRYRGSLPDLVRFLLPAHISGLAVGMLLYAADNVTAVAFAISFAIASKYVIRMPFGVDRNGRPASRHVFNPSNVGISVALVLFPTVGIAPPYQFTENTSGIADLLLPLVIVCTGTFLNSKATGRIPMILAWTMAFATQAVLRAFINATPVTAGLMPMTGFAFLLFTFYMITDPATTPSKPRSQVCFAFTVAAAYAAFMQFHIVFGLFYALTVVAAVRGGWIIFAGMQRRPAYAVLAASAQLKLKPSE